VKAQLWQKTIDAKCANQLSLAKFLAPGDARLAGMELTAHGKKPHKEAVCAKIFWSIVGEVVGEKDFTRERESGGLNSLLNYGYAVLLSTVLQKLFGVGLDPTFGIGHLSRERSTPLAYDLMEPFRPCVDWRVMQWIRQAEDGSALEVTKEFRKWVTGFPVVQIEHLDFTLEVQGVIEGVVRGFRKAVLENSARIYKPWIQRNSKWAG
jgi:CRISPR-associated protein Cas1